jgi:hypothetical protein
LAVDSFPRFKKANTVKARKRLSKGEKQVLNRLQTELDDKMAMGWATVAYTRDFSIHRGAWKVARSECVVFGNDCFSDDIRSRIEVAQLAQELERLGVKIKGFGISKDGGYTWALRVAFKDDYLLDRLVWHIWFVVFCGMEDNPARAELNERLKKVKRRKAA